MSKLFGWIAGRWATAAASNYLTVAIVALIGIGGVYIQQLRVKAARCEAAQEAQERYVALADRLAEVRNQDRDTAIDTLDEAVSDCLDMPVADLLRGDPLEGD